MDKIVIDATQKTNTALSRRLAKQNKINTDLRNQLDQQAQANAELRRQLEHQTQTNADLQHQNVALKREMEDLKSEYKAALADASLRLQTMDALKFSSLHLTRSMDLQTMLESILNLIFRLVPAENVHVFLYDHKTESLSFGAMLKGGVARKQPYSYPRKNGLTYQAAKLGEKMVVEDVKNHTLYSKDLPKGRVMRSKALIAIPLKIGDLVVGVMNVGFSQIRKFSQQELDIIDLFAMQAAIAIENARLFKQTQDDAKEMARLREQDRHYYEELNHTKDLLLDMTSHDLKNPIAIIKGYAEFLTEHGRVDDEIGRESLKYIQNGADKMLALVTDLLDLARIETGIALETESVNLNDLIHEAIDELLFTAKAKQITLKVELPDDPIFAELDQSRFNQALSNLISNAIKYTPQGGVVTVGAQKTPQATTITVKDNGFGIPEEDLPRLFDKFFRVKRKAQRDINGTGLGLAIVKTIVEQHQGRISVQSKLDEGSTFTLHFPQDKT